MRKFLIALTIALAFSTTLIPVSYANQQFIFCYKHTSTVDMFVAPLKNSSCPAGYQSVTISDISTLVKTLALVASSNYQQGKALGQRNGYFEGQNSQNGMPCIPGSVSRPCSDGLTHLK